MRGSWIAVALALTLASPRLRAQAPPPAPSAPDDAKKAEAIKHWKLGLELVDQKAWDGALAEFLRSRELYPTRNALKNAAFCLKELKRFDEALDMYDELLEHFGKELPAADRKAVDDDMAQIAKYVGTIAVKCEQSGARIVVDGRERGTTPLAKPVRVAVGTHAIAVSKEGFGPFETKVLVASGDVKTVEAKLDSLVISGTLRVEEETGAAYDVSVDGGVVGRTPWEGTVPTGMHAVALSRPDGEAGALPQQVAVPRGGNIAVRIKAVPLPAKLHVTATPRDARITIDREAGAIVSSGEWSGVLPSGAHTIEVERDGYFGEKRDVSLSAKTPTAIEIALQHEPPRWHVDAFAGLWPDGTLAMHLAYDGDSRPGPGGGSGSGVTAWAGARVGYRIVRALSLELTLAYAAATKSQSVGTAPDCCNYSATLYGPYIAAGASYQWFESTPLTVRLMSGVAFTSINYDAATGSSGHLTFPSPSQLVWATGPEVRFGVRFGRNFMVDLGVAALLAVPLQETHVPDGTLGGSGGRTIFTAPADQLDAKAALWILPSLGARLDF